MSIQKTYEATLIRVIARENDRTELMASETVECARSVPSNVTNGESYLAIVAGDGSIYDFYTGDTGTVQLSDIENDISEKLENDGDTVSVAIKYRDFFDMLAKDNKELINDVVKPKHFKACGINRTKKLIQSLNAGEIDYIKGFVFFHMVSSEEIRTIPITKRAAPDVNDSTNAFDFRNIEQLRSGIERGGRYDFMIRNSTCGIDAPYRSVSGQPNEKSSNHNTDSRDMDSGNCNDYSKVQLNRNLPYKPTHKETLKSQDNKLPQRDATPWDTDKRLLNCGTVSLGISDETQCETGTALNTQRKTLEHLQEILANGPELTPDITKAMRELSSSIKEHLMTTDKEQHSSIERKIRIALDEGDTVELVIGGMSSDVYFDCDDSIVIAAKHNGRWYVGKELNTIPLDIIDSITATKKIY